MKNLFLALLVAFYAISISAHDNSDQIDPMDNSWMIQTASDPCIDSTLIDPNIFCTTDFDPVCGCNNVTYSNSCYAEYTGGVTSWTPGACGPQPCPDPNLEDQTALIQCIMEDEELVCGCDGITYTNPCLALNFAGVWDYTLGPCDPDDCVNPSQIDEYFSCPPYQVPVCGCDGVTYTNSCFAAYVGGVISWVDGPCANQPCPDINIINPNALLNCPDGGSEPVCGCDGNTYTNACVAENFAGVWDYTSGSCDPIDCINSSQIDENFGCPEYLDPVCGCDGVTYSNVCFAMYIGGVISWVEGECETACIDESQIDLSTDCSFGYSPVCGCDTITYFNDCFASNFFGVTEFTVGVCETQCMHPDTPDAGVDLCDGSIPQPVCGCDNVTYLNDCDAFHNGGVLEWTLGACPNAIEEIPGINNIIITPNPLNSSSILRIESLENISLDAELLDVQGKVIRSIIRNEQVIGIKNVTIDRNGLSAGIYSIKLSSGKYVSHYKLIVID